ncbi:MAG: hypothetical protein GF313_06890 [Caldithrix sp.]|nr:hypothetical protein [Caldithrix sp.]
MVVPKPQLLFIELRVSGKDRLICDIAEKFYELGNSILIYVEAHNQAYHLDQLLWTWKQESFVPHLYVQDDVSQPEEPVIISTQNPQSYNCDVLILHDPAKPETLADFRQIIDFAELYNKDKHQASRIRFKEARDSGLFELEFQKTGEFFRNMQQNTLKT